MTERAGDRLRAYIADRMADRGIKSVSELARRANVSRDTFQQWWRGRPPQRSTAELVARELGVTFADLIAAREGSSPGASDGSGLDALINALRELVAEMRLSRAQVDESTIALLRAIAAVLPSSQERRGTLDDSERGASAGTGR